MRGDHPSAGPETEDDEDIEAGDLGPSRGDPAAAVASVVAETNGERVDAMLARALPDVSRARIQGLIGAGQVSVGDSLIKAASEKARAGAVYTVRLPPPEPAAPLPEAIPLTVVFEDDQLLVIDKAAGMAMHPAPGSMRGTLVNAVLAHCGASLSGIGGVARPGIVHRIDKDTTGLVVVAKTDIAHRGLADQFARHSLERAYFAVTRGAPHPRNGVIDTILARSGDDRRKMAVQRGETRGKRAITQYWTAETFGFGDRRAPTHAAAALVECRLKTGRTHQIRAHLAHLGCPLVGDPLYGKQRGFRLDAEGPEADAARAAVDGFARQALHAAILGFVHPVNGASLRFESALPPDLAALLAALRGV